MWAFSTLVANVNNYSLITLFASFLSFCACVINETEVKKKLLITQLLYLCFQYMIQIADGLMVRVFMSFFFFNVISAVFLQVNYLRKYTDQTCKQDI